MLAKILSEMKGLEDYKAIVPLLRSGCALTAEEAARLLEVCARHMPEITSKDEWKVHIAVDLMPGRGREDADDFSALALGEKNLDALFTARELFGANSPGTYADTIVETLEDDGVLLPVRMLLARTALDRMSMGRDFAQLRDKLKTMAEWLIAHGDELEKYNDLVAEAQWRFQV